MICFTEKTTRIDSLDGLEKLWVTAIKEDSSQLSPPCCSKCFKAPVLELPRIYRETIQPRRSWLQEFFSRYLDQTGDKFLCSTHQSFHELSGGVCFQARLFSIHWSCPVCKTFKAHYGSCHSRARWNNIITSLLLKSNGKIYSIH